MRFFKWLMAVIAILFVIYFLGPKPPTPQLDKSIPQVTSDLIALEKEISKKEAATQGIKEGNQSRIVWYDSAYQKTPYSIVYLHGFSASAGEGDPIHMELAERYGCNLYLPRLFGHGIESKDPLLELTPENLIESAKDAIAVASELGDKVIVLSTSTGGTLSLYLAGDNPDIHSLIAFSPNIEVYDPNSALLTKPWGLQMARMITGNNYFEFETKEENKKYWTTKYRLEALVSLQSLVENTMTEEVFKKVKQPFFMGYYYKNDSLCDHTVSVPRMLEMYSQLGTSEDLKRKVAFEDVGVHVLASKYTSKDLESVRTEVFKFVEEVLKLPPMATGE